MTPDELLEHKNRSPNVAFHRFVLISNKSGPSVLYCFFEGKDDPPYYISRILAHFDTYEPVICYGKKNVIAVFEKLSTIDKYKDYTIGYFLDKDYGPNLDSAQLYQTPTYSIENLYCTPSCFERILKHEIDPTIEAPNLQNCMEFFQLRQAEFHEAVLLLNGWYRCVKEHATAESKNTGVCLDDSLPSQFVQLDFSNGIRAFYTLDDIRRKFPDALSVTEDQIQSCISQFKGSNPGQSLRGKYEIQFLREFLRFLIEDANVIDRQQLLTTKTKFNFQNNLLISQLSQYADTPACLSAYLMKLKDASRN